ncbi:MAG: hypothetical protein HRU12_02830 [Phaeodactylibacter sp.]|nr:hypothetical protein [Phaeodactylibacter sp.]
MFSLFKRKAKHQPKKPETDGKLYVTMGYDLWPTITKGDGYVLPRRAEKIFYGKYYPTGKPGEWPVDPETGEKLPLEM